jgi:hypothetical protein
MHPAVDGNPLWEFRMTACGGSGRQTILTRTFKLSRDPEFESKFWDVIGLAMRTGTTDRSNTALLCPSVLQNRFIDRVCFTGGPAPGKGAGALKSGSTQGVAQPWVPGDSTHGFGDFQRV